MSPYAKRIHEYLLRAELPQGKLAQAINISHNHLSQVLSGAKPPFSKEIQSRISVALNLGEQEQRELENLAAISKITFRMRRGARPEEFQIAALFSDTTAFNVDHYIEIAWLALSAYRASLPKKNIHMQIMDNVT